jgi:hypothetical protein
VLSSLLLDPDKEPQKHCKKGQCPVMLGCRDERTQTDQP